MTKLPTTLFAPLTAIAVLVLAGCATASPAGSDTSGSDSNTSTSQNTGGNADKGHATITVDGETWDYPDFMCAVGYEATGSDTYSFSATSFKTSDGEKIQFLLDVEDQSGQNRLSGDGVKYHIVVSDYGGTSDSATDVDAYGTSGVTISGNSVNISGEFDTLRLDGSSVTIEADAVCR